ncbi:MFS transporter [Desulfosporosinus sp. PR]|uniref:MFS transporter n=1 Tax=Candidatus Desulfosporosinus nitrosoreducens TaxID=3401928 RepID=UPI0027FA9AD6|nr:MFS transporter [Desulfosporosinus sp. PR]MDQ7096550.1 MFS transporter [Desulfosporosinus sp. PR]
MALIAIMLGSLMVGFDGTIVSVANPQIAAKLHTSLGQLQWISNAYLLATAASLVLAGKLGDRFGRKLIFIIAVLSFAFSSLAIGLSEAVDLIIGFRVIQGIFGALILTNAMSLIRVVFPPEKLAAGVGVFSSANGLSVAVGPILGGIIVQKLGWEWAFFINTPIGFISAVLGIFLLLESKVHTAVRFDIGGVLLLSGTLIALSYAIIRAPSNGWGSTSTLILMAVSLVLLIGFILVEMRAKDPLLPLSLFSNRSISIGVIMTVLVMFALMGSLFFVMLYLQKVQGISPFSAGLRILPLGLGLLISAIASVPLIKRNGPRVPLTGGMIIMAAGLFIATFTASDSSYMILAIALSVLGIGLGVVIPASTDAIVGAATIEQVGAASGVQQTANQVGGVLGISILGAVMSSVSQNTFQKYLIDAHLPKQLIDSIVKQGGAAISQGIATIPINTSSDFAVSIQQGTKFAFMSGMHAAMMSGVIISIIGACGAFFITRSGPDGLEQEQ